MILITVLVITHLFGVVVVITLLTGVVVITLLTGAVEILTTDPMILTAKEPQTILEAMELAIMEEEEQLVREEILIHVN